LTSRMIRGEVTPAESMRSTLALERSPAPVVVAAGCWMSDAARANRRVAGAVMISLLEEFGLPEYKRAAAAIVVGNAEQVK
jgi:hypothetical protein